MWKKQDFTFNASSPVSTEQQLVEFLNKEKVKDFKMLSSVDTSLSLTIIYKK